MSPPRTKAPSPRPPSLSEPRPAIKGAVKGAGYSGTRPGLPDDGDLAALSDTFAGLSDPTRLRIIYTIAQRERSVGEIATLLGLSEPLVSQHLRRLRGLRMVRMRPDGQRRYYQLDDEHVTTLLAVCLEHVQGG